MTTAISLLEARTMNSRTNTPNFGYTPEPSWLPAVFVKRRRPISTRVHFSQFNGPDRSITTLCGSPRNGASELVSQSSYVGCVRCLEIRRQIDWNQGPIYCNEEEQAQMTEAGRRAYARVTSDYSGRLHQAEYARDLYVALNVHGIEAATDLEAQWYRDDWDDALADNVARNLNSVADQMEEILSVQVDQTPVTALLAAAGERSGVPARFAGPLAEAVAAQLGDAGSELANHTRLVLGTSSVQFGRYIPDPDPSEVPEWETQVTEPEGQYAGSDDRVAYDETHAFIEARPARSLDRLWEHMDASRQAPKDRFEVRESGRKAYAADFLGAPFVPGRTRVEHEADRGNEGRVTRSEDPAVWVRWADDPTHEYRYVAGELRQL